MRAALRALRLNRHFPDWKALAEHAEATGEPWPSPDDWLRVRVDRKLAPQILERLRGLEEDPAAAEKVAGFRRLLQARLLEPEASRLELVERTQPPTVQWTLDRHELSLARFVRWTLRLRVDRSHMRVEGDRLVPSAAMARRVSVLCWHTALELMAGLGDLGGLEALEVVRGEVAPPRPGPSGPWLSAVLSRVKPELPRVVVDDPLLEEALIPTEGSGLGLSRQRKWAVPRADLADAEAWLRDRGSRNLVYPYDP